MARYDTDDQALIHAAPDEVWSALLREFGGETHWWLPELEFRPLQRPAVPAVGTEVEVTPHVRGERWLPSSLAFVARVAELIENERLIVEYVRGAYLGRGEWLLEPVGEGTRLRMRWQVRSHGLLPSLSGLAVKADAIHSQMMQTGFHRLDNLLTAAPSPLGEPTSAIPAGAAKGGR